MNVSNPVIKIENLAKRYRIGSNENSADTLAGALVGAVRRPLQNLRRLRRLTNFSLDDEEDIIWALRDVSFTINQGEVVGIVGANGAGKSTLLKIMSRITAPTRGQIEIEGRVSSLLEVGTGFHPELTGRENVYLNGTILGMTRAEIDAKFDEIVYFAEIGKFINTPVKRYSTGMYARLAFAVAAFLEPEILLVDEVLSVGDAQFRSKSYARMQALARGGRTVLFVTHNMEAIRSFCTRAIYLDDGAILKDGEPISVVNFYLDRLAQMAQHEIIPENHTSSRVRLNRVVMRDWDGVPRTEFQPGDGIEFVMDYSILEQWDNFMIRLRVFAENGTMVLASGDNSTVASTPGNYVCVCRIPPGILNHGHYEVNLYARHGGSSTPFVKRNQMFFFVRQPDHVDNFDRLPGVLNPDLVDWRLNEFLEQR